MVFGMHSAAPFTCTGILTEVRQEQVFVRMRSLKEEKV